MNLFPLLVVAAVSVIGLAWLINEMSEIEEKKHQQRHGEILAQLERIVMNQTELAAELRAVKAQVGKIGTETAATLQKVIDLEAVIAAGAPVSEEVLTALAELKTQAQATDDLTPDAAPPTP